MVVFDFALRVAAALTLGAMIGAERQLRQRLAGLRTNALVSVGASLFVMVSVLEGDSAGHMRIAAQVVSGIGFLGAGVIMREGMTVRGLNTAATTGQQRGICRRTGSVTMKKFFQWLARRGPVVATYRLTVTCPAAQADHVAPSA